MDQVLGDPTVSGVYVAYPNGLHAKAVVAALRAGKKVLVEKPLCVTKDETEAIKSALLDTQRASLTEALMVSYHPVWHVLRKNLLDGQCGVLESIETDLALRLAPERVANLQPTHRGGGVWYDLAPYWVQALQENSMFPLDSWAIIRTEFSSRGTDLEIQVEGRKNGVNVMFAASYKQAYRARHTFRCARASHVIRDIWRPVHGCPPIWLDTTIDGQHAHRQKVAGDNYYERQLSSFISSRCQESCNASLVFERARFIADVGSTLAQLSATETKCMP